METGGAGRRGMSSSAADGWRQVLEAARREALARREQQQRREAQMSVVLAEPGQAGAGPAGVAAVGAPVSAEAEATAALGEAGSVVPAALAQESNIPDYLAAARQLENHYPLVANLVLRATMEKAQQLDPAMQGRGVLQFVTALHTLTARVPGMDDRSREEKLQEMELILACYQAYEQEVMRVERSPDPADRQKLGLVLRTAKVLVELYENLEKNLPAPPTPRTRAQLPVSPSLEPAAPPAAPEDLQGMNEIAAKTKMFQQLNYNIIPPHDPDELETHSAPQWRKREVAVQRMLKQDLRRWLPQGSNTQFQDVLDLLGFIFCFQKDNVRNQREHLTLLLANQRLKGPEDQYLESSIAAVHAKVLDNYIRWASYLHLPQDHMKSSHHLIHSALFLLIWGEGSNVRFLPECLCFLFHQMSRELHEILGKSPRRSAATTNGGEYEFLDNVITPIYQTLRNEVDYAYSGPGKPKGHPTWRNYDDMNEFFWSDRCLKLGWPLDSTHPFFVSHGGLTPSPPLPPQPRGSTQEASKLTKDPTFKANKKRSKKWLGKTFFVEWRSSLHIYHSFSRFWIFILLMLQAMLILAFSGPGGGVYTAIKLLSVFPAASIYQFLAVVVDLWLSFGCFKSLTPGMFSAKMARLALSTTWAGALSFFCIEVFISNMSSNGYLYVYLILVGAYVVPRLLVSLALVFSPYRKWANKVSNNRFIQFVKMFYTDQVYVGRGMYESMANTGWYSLFWLVLLISKFLFSYYMQILPMVGPTRFISGFSHLQYKWHDIVSSNFYNLFTLVSLWAPVIIIYLLDTQIWYTVLSSLVGTAIGAWWRLGEIRSLRFMRARFRSIPETFNSKLQHQSTFDQRRSTSMPRSAARVADSAPSDPQASTVFRAPSFRTGTRRFALAWNEIVFLLREEDLLSNKERDLLQMPPGNPSLTVAQWPLFLLANQIELAVQAAASNKEGSSVLWERIKSDNYRECAVLEAYQLLQSLLDDILSTDKATAWQTRHRSDVPEKKIVQRIFGDIDDAVQQGNLTGLFRLEKLPKLLQELSKLTAILVEEPKGDGIQEVRAVQALQGFYDSVCRDFFRGTDYRYSVESIHNLPPDYRLFSDIQWPAKKFQAKRLHLLLTMKESAGEVPHNLEARRRLEFFTNSLFMRMPSPPLVPDCIPFCVMTPYYSETVTYSMKQLAKPNEDGISDLYYLQKIYPDEWNNLLERVGLDQKQMNLKLKADEDVPELRMWASYRGQTLSRTVRGMMYYHRALRLLSFMETTMNPTSDVEMGPDGRPLDPLEHHRAFLQRQEHKDLADRKFTYVVTCQIYGQQKASKDERAQQIFQLMKENDALRVAYIDEKENTRSGGAKEYFSCLAKVDEFGNEQLIYRIKLPGPAKLGEGKPENQNHAVVFTRGEALQAIDMNQDNYFEEALKMRNLLEELRNERELRKPTILGVREHIFTGSVSSLAWFMSNQEGSFVTLGQRVLAIPLKVRMHYGHPDVFDRVFHITRGGVSKASRTINISEDIYAGFNTTLRQGNVTHHEYIQVGKGRDVGLNQIAVFEGKVAGGNGEQVLSRDIYRLGSGFDFFRMLSFFFTSVGFYICTLLTVLSAFAFLYGRAYLALSGVEESLNTSATLTGNQALMNAINTQFIIQLGFFSALPMFLGFVLEKGVIKAIMDFIVMQLQLASVFFTFSLGTRAHYFVRTLLHGGAKYRATGRGFVVKHIKFAENYRLYSRSHFTLGLEAIMLLIVYLVYGSSSTSTLYILITVSSWFLALSWCFAPFIFNPAGFDWQKTVADFDDWVAWLWYKGGVGLKGDQSWESWFDEETEHIHTIRSRIIHFVLNLRFFFIPYGMVYWLTIVNGDTSIVVYGIYWIAVVAGLLVLGLFNFSRGIEAQLLVRITQLLVFVVALVALLLGLFLTRLTIGDVFACLLAFVPTGWGLVQLAVAFRPTNDTRTWWWRQVRSMARVYDAAMGAVLFLPVAILSWFPISSTFQTRLMFNQAFSRGLEISLLLEAKPKD